MHIIDISPTVSESSALFPGDTPFSRKLLLDFNQGHNLVLSSIETSVHVGAHADAPNHYHPEGSGIDQRDLSIYIGTCQVISIDLPRGTRIFPNDIAAIKINAPRILFRTGSFPDPNTWNGDFNALSPDLVDFLADQGVRLVGLDTPSVDLADDKILESHQRLYARDVAVLENLVLDAATPGLYTLIALPLKLKDADASPVRAVLLPEGALV